MKDLVVAIGDHDIKAAFSKVLQDLKIPTSYAQDMVIILETVYGCENRGHKRGNGNYAVSVDVSADPSHNHGHRVGDMTSYINASEDLDDQMKDILHRVVKISLESNKNRATE